MQAGARPTTNHRQLHHSITNFDTAALTMADTGSESPPVSLRPWPAQDSSSEDLALQLRRLFEQRGHFRHITKESLQEDIANAKDGNVDLMQGVEEVDLPSVQDEKERRAEIMAAKVQMQQFIA
jgi:mediator of RNA polymerase II transcription subunit 17